MDFGWRILMARKIRVLIAKPGLDGHDRGAKVIARALRDAGMEVIYTGIRQTPEQIANTALQEGVDMVGLSCLSGAHNTLFPKVVQLLKEKGAEDIHIFCGGIIPADDIAGLKKAGIRRLQPGTPLKTSSNTYSKYQTQNHSTAKTRSRDYYKEELLSFPIGSSDWIKDDTRRVLNLLCGLCASAVKSYHGGYNDQEDQPHRHGCERP
jgi:methylmalonyl-CoA mutase C-terminal domain/subunit